MAEHRPKRVMISDDVQVRTIPPKTQVRSQLCSASGWAMLLHEVRVGRKCRC
jgi:hypothetical protein